VKEVMEWQSEGVEDEPAAPSGTPPHYSTTPSLHPAATSSILAALVAVALEVLALWCWGHAGQIATYYEPGRPDVMRSAVRAGAAAGVVGAQLVVLWFVLGRLFRRRAFDRVLSWALGLALAAAIGGTVALAVAGG
jgi:hypothetical protein